MSASPASLTALLLSTIKICLLVFPARKHEQLDKGVCGKMPPLEEVVEEAHKPRQSQLNVNQRQSSVSDILNKFTSNSFNRTRNHRITPYSHLTAPFSKQSRIPTPSRIYRSNSFFNSLNAFAGKNSTESVQGEVSQTRPATQPGILRSTSFFNNLSSFASKSSTSNSDAEKSPSRLPTPAGILRSSSLLGHLNTFTSKSASNTSDSDVSQHPPRKRSRKISDRLARTPFFSRPFERVPSSPQTPNKTRQSSVKIKQRGLMKPVHPPLPRSSTVGNLGRAQGQQSSPHT